VYEAGDGPTALTHAQAWRPDLILLDAELPPDGAEAVLACLRADPPLGQVPVVVLAYSRAPADRASITAFAGTYWLEKPYDLAELERTILALLPAPSARAT
jgi:CheY-like chemotaxis protein